MGCVRTPILPGRGTFSADGQLVTGLSARWIQAKPRSHYASRHDPSCRCRSVALFGTRGSIHSGLSGDRQCAFRQSCWTCWRVSMASRSCSVSEINGPSMTVVPEPSRRSRSRTNVVRSRSVFFREVVLYSHSVLDSDRQRGVPDSSGPTRGARVALGQRRLGPFALRYLNRAVSQRSTPARVQDRDKDRAHWSNIRTRRVVHYIGRSDRHASRSG
jgi:hypothetical protein